MNPPFPFPAIPRGVRPDAETADRIYLIKIVPELRATQQIRLLAAMAALSHKQLVLVTPASCRLGQDLAELMQDHPESIRREELR